MIPLLVPRLIQRTDAAGPDRDEEQDREIAPDDEPERPAPAFLVTGERGGSGLRQWHGIPWQAVVPGEAPDVEEVDQDVAQVEEDVVEEEEEAVVEEEDEEEEDEEEKEEE